MRRLVIATNMAASKTKILRFAEFGSFQTNGTFERGTAAIYTTAAAELGRLSANTRLW